MKKVLILFLALCIMTVGVSAAVYDELDYVNIGDTASEAGHTMVDWSYVGDAVHDGGTFLKAGGYGGHDGGSADYRGLMGPPTGCDSEHTFATITLHAGSNEAKELVVRNLDGSEGDSFDVCLETGQNWNCFAHYSADGTPAEDWKTTTFVLPDGLTGDLNFKFVATDPAEGFCNAGWGQVMFNWVQLDGIKNQIPEFGTIAALVALAGAVTAFLVLRKS